MLQNRLPRQSVEGCSVVQKIPVEIMIEIVIEIGRRGSTVEKIVIEN